MLPGGRRRRRSARGRGGRPGGGPQGGGAGTSDEPAMAADKAWAAVVSAVRAAEAMRRAARAVELETKL